MLKFTATKEQIPVRQRPERLYHALGSNCFGPSLLGMFYILPKPYGVLEAIFFIRAT